MAKISREIKVGVIVTCAIVALIWGLNYLKGQDIFSVTNKYYVIYPNVNGLATSNQIKLNGFKVGQVDDIRFVPDKSGRIQIALSIGSGVFISKDAKAIISSADILGTKQIEIELGSSKEPARDGDYITGEIKLGITETVGSQVTPVKDKVEHLLQSMDTLTKNLNAIFSIQNKKNFDEGLASLNNTMKHLNHISEMLDGHKGLNATVSNIESFSANLKDNNKKIDNIIGNLSGMTDSLAASPLKSAIDNLDKSMAAFEEILNRINKGEGSLGALIKDEKLYTNLNNSAAHLDSLMNDIKSNPKRYVHFSVFGKKNK